MRQAIPIRIVENLQLAAVTPEAIRRTLQGHATRVGAITGIEWHLIDFHASAAFYEAHCPYMCEGRGTLMASTRIDKHGKAELPFSDPGALCCDVCDTEIEARYNAEAAKLANPRRSSARPVPCVDCGQALPEDAPAQTRLCQPCATARAMERKRSAMAAKRAEG